MSTIFELKAVRRDYGQRRVVDITTLDIRAGELLALVGPSGAGKSTLLRLLNFLEPASGGEIRFRGQTYAAGRLPALEERRRITTVFQQPALLKRSVQENVAYGLRLRGLALDPMAAMLGRVGLADLASAPARTLSGGEAQRVALARALCLGPDVLLLDEPTANLDPYNVNLIEDIIQSHRAASGATIVLVTHNIFQARRLADRVAFMLNGQVVELATRQQFFDAPADPRTKAFIEGDMVY